VTSNENWSQKYLRYEFSEAALLERALTHRSYSATNNERLEFLGDAVLGSVIAETLHQQEDAADEGTLTRLRASLVKGETLADIATDMALGDILVLGGGEARTGGHQKRSFLAGGLEAVFGAVFLDGGYTAAQRVILDIFASRLTTLPDFDKLKDPKTSLQEMLQARAVPLPVYKVLAEAGPAHDPRFEVMCSIEELAIETTGKASSRRGAEQAAAAEALGLVTQ
jgi:ribonuclease-3